MTKDGEHKEKKSNSKNKNLVKRTKAEDQKLEKILIENFISMQKVMVNLTEKFDHLSKKLTELLDLFEDSAKVLSQKEVNLELKGENQEEILEKLKSILDQNKLIAKGLTLMHEANIAQKPKEIMPTTQMVRPQMGMPQMNMPVQNPIPQKEVQEIVNPNENMMLKKSKVLEEPDFSQFSQNA